MLYVWKEAFFCSIEKNNHLKKTIYLLTIGLLTTLNAFGQKADSSITVNSRNTAYLELGGNSLLYGINYERALAGVGKNIIATSVGYGFSYSKLGVFNEIVIPIEVKLLTGIGKRNHFEFGLGVTYFYQADRPDNLINGVSVPQSKHRLVNLVRVGYRYTSQQGLLFRIGLTPLIDSEAEPSVNLWGGISLGYCFK